MERLRMYMEMYYAKQSDSDSSFGIKARLCELADMWSEYMSKINENDTGEFDEALMAIADEKKALTEKLNQMKEEQTAQSNTAAILDEAAAMLEGLKNHPVTYDDQIVRQLVQYIRVLSADRIEIHFYGNQTIEAAL